MNSVTAHHDHSCTETAEQNYRRTCFHHIHIYYCAKLKCYWRGLEKRCFYFVLCYSEIPLANIQGKQCLRNFKHHIIFVSDELRSRIWMGEKKEEKKKEDTFIPSNMRYYCEITDPRNAPSKAMSTTF